MNHNIFSSLILPFSLLIKNLFIIIIIINLTFLLLQDHYFVGAVDQYYLNCSLPARTCGDNQTIRFPFYLRDQQNPYCGYPGFEVSCDEDGHSILNLFVNDPYIVRHISYEKRSLIVSNAAISHNSTPNCIPPLQNISFPNERFKLPKQNQVFLLSDCSPPRVPEYEIGCSSENATNWILGVPENEKEQLGNLSKKCGDGKVVVMPVKDYDSSDDESVGMRQVLSRGFELTWKADDCSRCQNSGGVCGFNTSSYLFQCYCEDRPHRVRCQGDGGSRKWKLGLGIGVGFLGLFLIAIFIICCYKKRRASSNIFSRSTTDPYLNTDVEGGSCYFGVPVFPFNDLAKATNNFASEKELGDGGFGSVYHGKLKDGREVAVKRLYEHNYKRVEQFMNEIEILTRLRHRNLVSLYGCTSRHSRELLLVYEYIPNGTVADHLHGEQAKPGLLPWSIRMSIAIETATALAYLHASEIVHRDVKTNNILLDNNFTVKVADFGLSRLFPNDVTHVSTAPQGTPGYVDPEYHQCYQLTSKSDVYSFGVVLIELISSLPAVDITRHRHEINLANLATSKIQKCEFHELIDPSTGFETDSEVRRMTIAVAELAFQCLQQNKEMRPSMEEVLETLKSIESREDSPLKMAALQKFKLLATQCGVTQSPTRSPRTSPLVQLRRRKTTLRMLLTRSTGRRSPRRRESLAYQLRPEPLPEKRNERESQSEKVLAPPRPSLKDLFVSSPPFEGERGRDDNFKERGFGGENRELGLVCKGIYGSSTGWQYGPGSPRPVWTGLRYKSLLRRAWRPVLVTIPES